MQDRAPRRRIAAIGAFALLISTVVVAAVLLPDTVGGLLFVIVATALGASGLFVALTRRDWVRLVGWAVVIILLFWLIRLVVDNPQALASVLLVISLAWAGVISARSDRIRIPAIEQQHPLAMGNRQR